MVGFSGTISVKLVQCGDQHHTSGGKAFPSKYKHNWQKRQWKTLYMALHLSNNIYISLHLEQLARKIIAAS